MDSLGNCNVVMAQENSGDCRMTSQQFASSVWIQQNRLEPSTTHNSCSDTHLES